MPEGLAVTPVITVTAVHQSASSGCHGALLNPGTEPETYTCRECGSPCERVLGDPEEVTFHG
jgi:hypothetical protein